MSQGPTLIAGDLARLLGLNGGELSAHELGEVGLSLASLDHPGIDLAPYRAHLADLGHKLKAALVEFDPAEALSLILAVQAGYTGDRIGYDDPANADLIQVIDRRRGLPVALGVIYLDVAAKAGLPMTGLNFPGHFLVRLNIDRPVIIDPFNDGAVIDEPGLRRLLKSFAGADVPSFPGQWQAAQPREVLLRLMNNVKIRALKAKNDSRAAEMLERMTALAPEDAALWFERAMVDADLGHIQAARQALATCLSSDPNPSLRQLAQDKLGLMQRSLN